MLEVNNLTVSVRDKNIVKGVSFSIKEHDLLMVIGPNGAGKTTLIRGIMGILPHRGTVTLEGRDIKSFSSRQLAQKIGVLAQKHQLQFPHTVYQLVGLGRYAHRKSGIFNRLQAVDHEKIQEAIFFTGLEDLKMRSVLTLSGGELQRAFLAQVLAQDPQILILDEPANYLDIQYQIAIFNIIREWVSKKKRAVFAVVHDLNLAYTYGTRALLMSEGRIYAQGAVKDVLSRDNLKDVYKVDVAKWMQKLLKNWSE
jgi:iron complex transport system ATP-binding protein